MEKLLLLHQNNIHKCQNTLKFMENLSQFKQKLQKSWKFWPSNILYYTVCGLLLVILAWQFGEFYKDQQIKLHSLYVAYVYTSMDIQYLHSTTAVGKL